MENHAGNKLVADYMVPSMRSLKKSNNMIPTSVMWHELIVYGISPWPGHGPMAQLLHVLSLCSCTCMSVLS